MAIIDNGFWNNRDLSKWDVNIGEPGYPVYKYNWDTDKYFPAGERKSQLVGSDWLFPYTSVDALVSAYGETAIGRWATSGETCFPIVTVKTKNVYGTCLGGTSSVVFFILPDDIENNNFGLYIKYPKTIGGYNAYAYKGGSKLAPVWTGTSNVIAKVGTIAVNGVYKQSLYRPLNYEGGLGSSSYGGTNWDDWYDYPVQRGEPSANSALSPWHGSSRVTQDGRYIAQVQIVLGNDEGFSGAAPYGYAIGYIPPIYGFTQEHEVTDAIMGPSNNGNIDVTIKGRSADAANFGNLSIYIGQYYKKSQGTFSLGTKYPITIPYGEQFISATSQWEKNTGNKIAVELINPRAMNPKMLDSDADLWIPYVESNNSRYIFYHASVVSSTGDITIPSNYSAVPGLGYVNSYVSIEEYSMELVGSNSPIVTMDIEDITFYADPNDRPVLTAIRVGKVDFRNHHHEMMLCGEKKDMYRIEVEGTAAYGGGMCNIYMGGVRVGTCTLPGYIELTGFSVVPFSEGVNGDISAQAYDMKGFLSEGQLAATAIHLIDGLGSPINTDKPTIGVAYQKPYLYNYPTIKITNIWRSNSSGQEDLENGTYAYIQGNFTGFTKNGLKLTVVLTGDKGNLVNQEYSAADTFGGIYAGYDVDHNHTFTATVTDVFGGTSSASKAIYSAACFMDFRAGGKALGIGMAALGDERVDIKWPIYAHGGVITTGGDVALAAKDIQYTDDPNSITLKDKLDQMDTKANTNATNISTLQTFVNGNIGAAFQHVASTEVNDFILVSLGANTDQKLAIATIKNREVTRPTSATNNVYRQVLTAPWDSKGYKTVYPIYAETHLHAYTNGYDGVGANDYEMDGKTAYATYARSGIGYSGGNYYVGYESDWPRKNNSSSATTCYVSGMLMAIVQPK